jgi:class 3 adenylate cyclase
MFSIDVRDVLPAIRVPALVMYSEDVQVDLVAISSDLAENLADARCIAVPGDSTVPYLEPGKAAILAEIEEFLTGTRSGREADRILASVLFTDLVGSTEMAAALGDSRWRQLLESHNSVSRTVVEQHRGRLIKTTGDGILATFEGPGRAIQCARSLRDALSPLGLTIRAGLHTGEVELLGEDIGGVAVHVAARVLGHARANELLVSAAVPMLVAGSGLEFEARGEYDLKGLDGTWTLFALKT